MHIKVKKPIIERGETLEHLGIAPIDAPHVASAESEEMDFLFTTDDQLIRAWEKNDKKSLLL